MLETFQFVDSQKKDRPSGRDERQRSAGLRLDRRRRAFRRGLSDHAVVGHHGIAPPRIAEIRRHLRADAKTKSPSISMAIGASYAGRVAVTGSSGPGISLKTEALGWAVMAEMPLVIVDVQRGGPSTGMPTNVEQSDLNIAVLRRPRRFAARRARAGQRRRLFLHRDRSREHRAQIQRAGYHPERPGHRHAHRGVSRSRTWKKFARIFRRTSRRSPITSLTICPRRTASRRHVAPGHAHHERQISRSPPVWNTTNWAIRPARRSCTCR